MRKYEVRGRVEISLTERAFYDSVLRNRPQLFDSSPIYKPEALHHLLKANGAKVTSSNFGKMELVYSITYCASLTTYQ
ncbi:hypothetical protein SAMN06298216_0695 [Spirosomataceae bacterium TFI 002]|nr:hypothetical protein SAMN06298216_0695 [Spirosomataceae bacterium TFI 002]